MRILSRAFRMGAAVTVAVGVSVGLAVSAQAGDSPAGFNFGTDSWPTSRSPARLPTVTRSWAATTAVTSAWSGTGRAWKGARPGTSSTVSYSNRDQANTDYNTYHIGIGTAAYWYMGGPGVDPHWNGTYRRSGQLGRAAGVADMLTAVKCAGHHVSGAVGGHRKAGHRARPGQRLDQRVHLTVQREGQAELRPVDRGPRRVQRVRRLHHRALDVQGGRLLRALDLASRSSAPCRPSLIPNTYEWTYWPETSNLNAYPYAWRLSQGKSTLYAQFFGGQTYSSTFALMWQWSGGGGVRNGLGDFDQIDVARMR